MANPKDNKNNKQENKEKDQDQQQPTHTAQMPSAPLTPEDKPKKDEPEVTHTVEMQALQPQKKEAPAAPGEKEKSSTVELKVVQQKKKELEDRLKTQGTIRLRQPTSGPRAEGPKQSTSETYKVKPEETPAGETKTSTTTIGTESGKGTTGGGGGAKRTLKIKPGGAGGKTMKLGDEAAGAGAARSGVPGREPQVQTEAAAVSGVSVFANLVAFVASAATFTFLLLHYLELYR